MYRRELCAGRPYLDDIVGGSRNKGDLRLLLLLLLGRDVPGDIEWCVLLSRRASVSLGRTVCGREDSVGLARRSPGPVRSAASSSASSSTASTSSSASSASSSS